MKNMYENIIKMEDINFQNNIRLIHWNCRSFSNKINFKKYISDTQPDIVALQETRYRENSHKPTITSYSTLHKVRPNNGNGGGLLLAISNSLNYRVKTLKPHPNPSIELHCIAVQLKNSEVDIVNVYAPPNTFRKEEFMSYKKQLNKNYIICGDFNAHHETWDPGRPSNKEGQELNEILDTDDNICIATPPGLITHTDSNGSTSTIDLILCNPALIPLFNITPAPDFGSDHTPIIANIEIYPNKVIRGKRPKWKLDSGKWKTWKSNLTYPKSCPTTRQPGDLEQDYHNFTTSIIKACQGNFKKTSNKVKYNMQKPWWNEHCSKATALRRRAKRKFQRTKSLVDRIEYRKRHAEATRTHKHYKKLYWAEYVASLSSNTTTGSVWTAVKKMTGTYRQSFQPLKKNQELFFSKEEKAQIHTKSFQKQMYSTNKKQYDKDILSTIKKAKQKGNQKIDQRFTIHEFHNTIDNLKQKKAYGSDEICNEFIKNLPTTKKQELLGIYNRSWQTGKLPAEWKLGLIIPILKPGKCPLTPETCGKYGK